MLKEYSLYKPIGLMEALLFTGIYFGGMISGLWNQFLHSILPSVMYSALIEMEVLYTLPLVILGIIFYGRAFQESWYQYKNYFWRSTCMLIVTFIFVTVFISAIAPFIHAVTPENQSLVMDAFQSTNKLVFFVIVCIMTPFIEEIIFRHILIGQVSEKLPLWMAAFISIVLFTFMHCSQVTDIWFYLPSSIVLTAIYIGFGNSISHSYAYHMINNFASFLLAMQ